MPGGAATWNSRAGYQQGLAVEDWNAAAFSGVTEYEGIRTTNEFIIKKAGETLTLYNRQLWSVDAVAAEQGSMVQMRGSPTRQPAQQRSVRLMPGGGGSMSGGPPLMGQTLMSGGQMMPQGTNQMLSGGMTGVQIPMRRQTVGGVQAEDPGQGYDVAGATPVLEAEPWWLGHEVEHPV